MDTLATSPALRLAALGPRTAFFRGRSALNSIRNLSRLLSSKVPIHIGVSRLVASVILAAMLSTVLADPLPVKSFRLRIFDFFQEMAPRHASAVSPVAIVDIDEESLKEVGQWPWPRTVLAKLVARISKAHPAAIGFDVIFPEPDRLNPANLANMVKKFDPSAAQRLRTLPSNDQVFSQAIRTAGNVVLGIQANPRHIGMESANEPTSSVATLGASPTPYLAHTEGLVGDIPILDDAAAGRGLLSIEPEVDGIVRRVPLMMVAAGKIFPALSLEMLRVATGESTYVVRSDQGGVRNIVIAGQSIPTDGHGRIWVYFSPPRANHFLSAKDVLAGRVPDHRMRGRLVLIGSSATGLQDIKATPLGIAMPGVAVHAQLLETIASGKILSRPSWAKGAEIFAAIAISVMFIVLVPAVGAVWAFVLGIFCIGTLFIGAWVTFKSQLILLDPVTPAGIGFVVYGTLVFLTYYLEERQKRSIRRAFSQYLSPELVTQLADRPERLALGGEVREMTFLFGDIVGFTNLSESFKEDPHALTHLLNGALTPMSDCVLAHRGTIDKYMGDCIMAFWNAPLDDPEHAKHACRAALDMHAALAALGSVEVPAGAGKERTFSNLRIGIGINTGEAFVGNMGSRHRFDYSVIGDSVNLASRLQGLCREYDVSPIVGETTASALGNEFTLFEIDHVRVKGLQRPERIFTILHVPLKEVGTALPPILEIQRRFLAAYYNGDWESASFAIQESLGLGASNFGLAGYYGAMVTRLNALRRIPPHAWDSANVNMER